MSQPNMNPQQLQMFMTPRDIKQQYQPLDADREEQYDSGYEPHAGSNSALTQATARSTHQREPDIRVYKATAMTHTRGGGIGYRSGGGNLYRDKPDYEPTERTESDEQLWERKGEEATEYGEESYTGGQYSYQSLYESVEEHGVQHPVHLGSQFGTSDKPQIVGGHHRIAAAAETRPDELIPVLHHDTIFDAKNSTGYKYR